MPNSFAKGQISAIAGWLVLVASQTAMAGYRCGQWQGIGVESSFCYNEILDEVVLK